MIGMTDNKSAVPAGLPYHLRVSNAAGAAASRIETAFPGKFDISDIIAEPVSHRSTDRHLWIVAARYANSDDMPQARYAAWSMNLDHEGLDHGCYDLTIAELDNAIARKRGYTD